MESEDAPPRTRAEYEELYPFVLYNYALSFRAHHPTLSAKEVRAVFRMRPKISRRVGEPRRTPRGNLLKGVWKNTYLCFEVTVRVGEELPDAIERILKKLRKRSKEIQAFRASGGRMDFFIGIFVERNKGVTFEPDLLAELADVGIELQLDIYGSAMRSGF